MRKMLSKDWMARTYKDLVLQFNGPKKVGDSMKTSLFTNVLTIIMGVEEAVVSVHAVVVLVHLLEYEGAHQVH